MKLKKCIQVVSICEASLVSKVVSEMGSWAILDFFNFFVLLVGKNGKLLKNHLTIMSALLCWVKELSSMDRNWPEISQALLLFLDQKQKLRKSKNCLPAWMSSGDQFYVKVLCSKSFCFQQPLSEHEIFYSILLLPTAAEKDNVRYGALWE